MVLELHKNEVALILALRRKFRHNEVVIVMRNGIPQYIKQAWTSLDLLRPEDLLTDQEDSGTVGLSDAQ